MGYNGKTTITVGHLSRTIDHNSPEAARFREGYNKSGGGIFHAHAAYEHAIEDELRRKYNNFRRECFFRPRSGSDWD